MCILAIKPSGVLSPNEETLRQMFKSNPDGGGVAYNLNGKIKIIKGLMTVEEFITEVNKIPVESTALIHTRIQTAGGVCKELTHPYPLTNDYEKLTSTNLVIKNGFAVAHNGIFSGFANKSGYNDTIQFIGNYLTPMNKLCEEAGKSILDKSMIPVINRLVDTSRLAIIDCQGNFEKYGNGWTEDNGIWYSNTSYKPYTYTYSSYSRYNWLDYNEEAYYDEWYNTHKYNKSTGKWEEIAKAEEKDEELEKLILKYPEYEKCLTKWYDYGYPISTLTQWAEKGWLYEEEV